MDDISRLNALPDRQDWHMAFGQAVPPPIAQPKKKKGFLVDNISTVGGIIGGLGGGALGGLFGAGVGALPGAAAGGAAGSGFGEMLENILTGEDLTKNVAKEAILGGIFSAGPVKLAKFGLGAGAALTGGEAAAGGLVKGFAQGAGKAAAGETAEQAGEQVLKTSLRGKLTTSGNKLLASQYGTIDKPVIRETRPMETISKLADMGILKPSDAERTAHAITGSNGILTQQVAKAIGKAGKVSTGNVENVFNAALAEHGVEPAAATALKNTIDAQMGIIAKEGNAPQTILKVMQNLEKRAANMEGKGGNYRMSTPERVDGANVLRAVRDELQDQLYNVAGGNANLPSVLTSELREQLIKLHPKNAQWQSFVDNTVMKAKSVGDLRAAQSPFVRVSKIIDNGDQNLFGITGRVGNAFGGPGGFMNKAVDTAVGMAKNPASRVAGSTLRDIGTGQALNQSAKGLKGIAGNLGTASFIANSFMPDDIAGATSLPDDSRQQPNTLQDALMMQGSTGGTENVPNTRSATPDDSGNPYGIEALKYDLQRDPANAGKYIEIYNQLADIFSPEQKAGDMPYSRPTAQQYSQGVTGIQSIGQLAKMIQEDPDVISRNAAPGQNLPFGIGSRVSGNLGTGNYRAVTNNILNSIARINTGANMPESERVFYEQTYLPQPGDDEQTKIEKLRNLYGFFQPIVSYSGQPSNIEEALMQQGGY